MTSSERAATGKAALYPGSFDPVTLGHLDIIERSSRLFSRVIVALSCASGTKAYAFTVDQRKDMLERITRRFDNVEVVPFSGLLTQFAERLGARVLVRGLRAITDFEYEFQMASMNSSLAPDIETVFLMTSTRYSYLSSSIVKEIATHQGEISHLVPAEILEDLRRRFRPAGLSAPGALD